MNINDHLKNTRTRRATFMDLLCRLLALCICGLPLPGRTTTPTEEKLNKAPMPHELRGLGGGTVKVHLVSARGYMEGRPDDAARRSLLHAEVDDCVRRNSAGGIASKPPNAWPDHLDSQRIDSYFAINRTIRYADALRYSVHPLDCSLVETHISSARLHSSQGGCHIDLREKTAHGACDATGHAHAKPPTRLPGLSAAQIAAIERSAATNPAMAAFAAAVRSQPPAGTGARKAILGIECEVRPNPLDLDGTVCGSLGGSFASLDVPGDLRQSGLVLEMTSITGIKMRATKAKLDTMVSSSVFTPYLAGGFRITDTGPRR